MPFDPSPPVIVLLEDRDGRWWAMGSPQPPAGIPAKELWDAWDPHSEPASAWSCIGPCESAEHAAQASGPDLPFDVFEESRQEDVELAPDNEELKAWDRAVIAAAVPPGPWDPSGPRPLKRPPPAASAPTRGYLVQIHDSGSYPELGIERQDSNGMRFLTSLEQARTLAQTWLEDDSDNDAYDVWSFDLTGLPCTVRADDIDGLTVLVHRRIPADRVRLEATVRRPRGLPGPLAAIARWLGRPALLR